MIGGALSRKYCIVFGKNESDHQSSSSPEDQGTAKRNPSQGFRSCSEPRNRVAADIVTAGEFRKRRAFRSSPPERRTRSALAPRRPNLGWQHHLISLVASPSPVNRSETTHPLAPDARGHAAADVGADRERTCQRRADRESGGPTASRVDPLVARAAAVSGLGKALRRDRTPTVTEDPRPWGDGVTALGYGVHRALYPAAAAPVTVSQIDC